MRLPALDRNGRYKLEAKTAYGLLSTIIAIVQDDARTMRMGSWDGEPRCALDFTYLDKAEKPLCGTVGCIGGWVNHLTNTNGAKEAAQVLGYASHYWGAPRHLFFLPELCCAAEQGTRKHAAAVIKHIRKFQRENHYHLTHTRVTVRDAR